MSEDKGRTFALKLKGVPVGFLGICLSEFIVSKDGINWQYRVRTAGFCGVTEGDGGGCGESSLKVERK